MDTETPIPCPVCKSPADKLETSTGHYVYCSNDDCPKRPVSRIQPTEAEAIAAWNRGEII